MRILIVVQPERFDFYDYLKEDLNSEYTLLWHEERKEKRMLELPIDFKEEYFWRDYNTPFALIEKVRPDRIVLFEIIDLRQIALIVACKSKGIETFYLEHGAAGSPQDLFSRWKEADNEASQIRRVIQRLRGGIGKIISAKVFYYSVMKGFTSWSSYFKYLSLPFKFLNHIPNVVLANTIFPERVPDFLITFSRLNYQALYEYTGASIGQALFTGIPFFDKYFSANSIDRDYLVFIDHPYFEEKRFDWDIPFHQSIAVSLYNFAKKMDIKVYVKLHPKSDISLWHSYDFEKSWVEILQNEDCTQLFLESKLILGYSSSLLTAFLCAHKNVVLLGWHPEPRIIGYNFFDTGLCHISFNPIDLVQKFDSWCGNNLSFNEKKYDEFIKLSNPHFDGQATERVIKLISGTSLP